MASADTTVAHRSVNGIAPRLPSRIPSLDGMRALSIGLVVAAHSVQHDAWPALLHGLEHLGNYGVRIFFVISGFLITHLLLREYDANGTVSLRNFYMRRMIRIFPPFYVYAAVVGILAWRGIIPLVEGDMLYALTYTMNYKPEREWYLNHTWSLAVEEQFYLLWPAVLLLARPPRALRIALGAILVVPLIRAVMYIGFNADGTMLARHFQAVCDALATGCLLAGIYNRLGEVGSYRRLQSRFWYPLVPGAVIGLSAVTYLLGAPVYYIVGQSIANLGALLLLDYAVRCPGTAMGRLLNTRPLVAMGVVSYSVYLWQELFLDFGFARAGFGFPWNLVAVAVTSLLSYYLIEKQFMRLRKWFAPEPRAKAAR